MRATWLTDLHLDFPPAFIVDGFLEQVKAVKPDVIFVTGDTGEAETVEEHLGRLNDIAPTYFVLGNHDYYGSSIADVRRALMPTKSWSKKRPAHWIPGGGPVALTPAVMLVGVDGWYDARAGNLRSRVKLADWIHIHELVGLSDDERVKRLQKLGRAEARALGVQLTEASLVAPFKELIVLTHVPPFVESAQHEGKISGGDWLPWFTCAAVGHVLMDFATENPDKMITVLCGHTHCKAEYRPLPNLFVRTGGWAPELSKFTYGNPVIQDTWELSE